MQNTVKRQVFKHSKPGVNDSESFSVYEDCNDSPIDMNHNSPKNNFNIRDYFNSCNTIPLSSKSNIFDGKKDNDPLVPNCDCQGGAKPCKGCNDVCSLRNLRSLRGNNPDISNQSNFGSIPLPGNETLTEFPAVTENPLEDPVIAPREYTVTTTLCVSTDADFATAASINKVIGDIVFANPPPPPLGPGLSTLLPSAIILNDVFPNLISVEGSIYIIGTNYDEIKGFPSLRYVTGSIVIANNPYLTKIPDFPALLTVGGGVVIPPPIIPQSFNDPASAINFNVSTNSARSNATFNASNTRKQTQKGNIQTKVNVQTRNNGQNQTQKKNIQTKSTIQSKAIPTPKIPKFNYFNISSKPLNNNFRTNVNAANFNAANINSKNINIAQLLPDPNELDPRCAPGMFIISNNSSLLSIYGINCLKYVKNAVIIANNASLNNIAAFGFLRQVPLIVIFGNPVLALILAFINLSNVVDLFIANNNINGTGQLVFRAFQKLYSVTGLLVITGNRNIVELVFNKLNIVCEALIIRSNQGLECIALEYLTVVGDFIVESNRNLLTLKYILLKQILGRLSIANNCALKNIYPGNDLGLIASGVIIAENGALQGICAFNETTIIGARCLANTGLETPIICCQCTVDNPVDWVAAIRRVDCAVTINLPLTIYNDIVNQCAYTPPNDFFVQLAYPSVGPNQLPPLPEDVPGFITYSIIVYRNNSLKGLNIFNKLRVAPASINIVGNPTLHTITSFAVIGHALDVWIRNNPNLRYLFGFSELINVRDFILMESTKLLNFRSLKCLESSQLINLEVGYGNSVEIGRNPLPSVFGYLTYFQGLEQQTML